MRILHLITALNVGGAETMLARLLAEERRARPEVQSSVLSLMMPGLAGGAIRTLGIPVQDCGVSHWRSLPNALARLAWQLRKTRPDLIVGWMYHAQLAAAAGKVLALSRVPMIWNVRHSLHDLRHERTGTRAILGTAGLLSRWPRAVVYNSRVAARQYEALGYAAERTTVIPNGFDLTRFQPDRAAQARLRTAVDAAPDALLVGLAARNHPMKDPATLVRAVRLARNTGVDVHLLLVGAGMTSPSSELREALAALPADRITVRDHEADMAALLPGLDVLALSSAWGEGFPNILGEAMACGVPCIATDVGDSRWVLGETGMVVPPGDLPAMAAALTRLARMTPTQRRALGLAARRRVEERFSIAEVANSYHRLFATVTGDQSAAPLIGPTPAPVAAQ